MCHQHCPYNEERGHIPRASAAASGTFSFQNKNDHAFMIFPCSPRSDLDFTVVLTLDGFLEFHLNGLSRTLRALTARFNLFFD